VKVKWDCGETNEGHLSEYKNRFLFKYACKVRDDQDEHYNKKGKQNGMGYNLGSNPHNMIFFFLGREFVDASKFKRVLSDDWICHT